MFKSLLEGLLSIHQALILASACDRNHLFPHKAVELSTYGILFLGTPHQGSATVDFGMTLFRILSVYDSTNDAVLKDLQLHSKPLQQQLYGYSAISHKYITKFYYEMYETKLFSGISKKVGYSIWLIISSTDEPPRLLNSILQLFQGHAIRSRLDFTKIT